MIQDMQSEHNPPAEQRKGVDGLVSASHVAPILGVDPGTVRRWADEGFIPAVIIRRPGRGAVYRFDPTEVRVLARRHPHPKET